MYRLAAIIIVFLCSAGTLAAKEWRGILPLHSTRENVERLLGPPPDQPADGSRIYALHKGRSIYFLEEGEVFIVFNDQQSDVQTKCPMAVPDDTVLLIQVTPKGGLLVKDLDLQTGFRKFNPTSQKETEYEGFINEEDGLVIRAYKGVVESMVYVASAIDRPRCPDYYGKELESLVSVSFTCGLLRKFDEYGDLLFSDEKARLDNFAIQIQNSPEAIAHVIVYAGQKAVAAEAQLRGNRIKNYLLNVREIDPKRVTVVDGGHMDSLTVQLYLLPDGATPPEPDPTVKAEDVQIVFEKPKRRGRKNR